jgi:YcxB-like protein
VQINMWVPFDEKRLRRTLQFILKPQLRSIRLLGLVLVLLGLPLAAVKPSNPIYYTFVFMGLLFMALVGPITVGRALRMQSNVMKEGLHMALDSESITVTYPLVESRFKWAGVVRVIDTPEAWYVMFGKVQSITVPKDTMTEEQRAEFAEFVKTLNPQSASAVR